MITLSLILLQHLQVKCPVNVFRLDVVFRSAIVEQGDPQCEFAFVFSLSLSPSIPYLQNPEILLSLQLSIIFALASFFLTSQSLCSKVCARSSQRRWATAIPYCVREHLYLEEEAEDEDEEEEKEEEEE